MSYTSVSITAQQAIGSTVSTAAKEKIQINPVGESVDSGKWSTSNGTQYDQSTLSYAAALVTQALSGSADRAHRIGAIQQAIGSGVYRVSAANIADKLISSMVAE